MSKENVYVASVGSSLWIAIPEMLIFQSLVDCLDFICKHFLTFFLKCELTFH